MNLKEMFREMEKLDPELGRELKDGSDKREEAAKRCAKQDAPVLKKPEAELVKLYEQLFFNIATDELFQQCADATPQARWNMVEPFTWFDGKKG